MLRPELVSRLVLITPPLVFTTYKSGFWIHVLGAPFVRSEKAATRFAKWFVSDPTFDDPAARSWLDQFSIGMPHFTGMNGFPRPSAFTDRDLRSIAAPVLLIEGEEEPMHDPAALPCGATTLVADVRTELLPGTKHVAELEQPEQVNDLVLTFLDAV